MIPMEIRSEAGTFQLTPSRRATAEYTLQKYWAIRISTHALTEGDPMRAPISFFTNISTHALTEGDGKATETAQNGCISTHALTEGDGSC